MPLLHGPSPVPPPPPHDVMMRGHWGVIALYSINAGEVVAPEGKGKGKGRGRGNEYSVREDHWFGHRSTSVNTKA